MSDKYSEEFKCEIVFLRKSGKSVKELTQEYGLGKNTVSKWMKQYDSTGSVIKKHELSAEQQEIKKLQKALSEHEAKLAIIQRVLSTLVKKKS